MDTDQTPGPESEETPAGGDVRRLMDQAARAYMDGDYNAAVGAWREVLDVDPGNPRAREGIKKVSMLQADDSEGEELPFDPVLEEVEDLLKRRRFEEALSACRQHAEGAGPALRTALRMLEQRAEHARAIEPEIMRCMANARRSLQEGDVGKALPQLKQALTLDRDHPVARRLMDGLRQRARRRNENEVDSASPPQAAPSTQAMSPEPAQAAPQDEAKELPASGQPGSDAPPLESLSSFAEEPAPLGHGLPSSPVGRGPDPSAPEIELDMLSLDDGTEPLTDEDGEELIAGAPMAIELENEEPVVAMNTPGTDGNPLSDLDSRREAASGEAVESPFAPLEDEMTPPASSTETEPTDPPAAPDLDRSQPEPEAMVAGTDAIPEMTGDDLATLLGSDNDEAEAKPVIPRAGGSSSGKRSPLLTWGGLAAVVLLGTGVAAWQMGWLFSPQADFAATPEGAQEAVATGAAAAPAEGAASPQVNEAQGAAETAAAGPQGDVRPEATPARQALMLLEQGQDLFDAGRPTAALDIFRQAQTLDPANGEISSWVNRTEDHLNQQDQSAVEHEAAVAAFEKKDFEAALRGFYRMQEEGGDKPYEKYIANTWYNWGLQLLAAGNLREAANKMDEVLGIKADDVQAGDIKKLVTSYSQKAKDREFYQQIEGLRYRLLDS